MRIAICDDDRELLPHLEKRIAACFQYYKTEMTADTFENGLDLRAAVNGGAFYDVIFLDIDMPDCDGIAIGAYLMKILPSSCLIFVSNKESRVFDAFAAQPFRFVRKSRFNEEMPEAVEAVIRKINHPTPDEILITHGSKTLRINPIRIMYAESSNNDITIYTDQGEYTTRHTLGALEKELSGYGFIRTHRGYLVNYRYIYRIEKNFAILDNDRKIPISRSYMKSTKETFQKLLQGRS